MKDCYSKIIVFISLLLCFSTVDAAEPPISSACLFVADFYYLGPVNGNNMKTYGLERDYLITVEDKLFLNKTQYASAAFYGYSEDPFVTQMKYAKNPLDAQYFGSEVNSLWPPGSDMNYVSFSSVIDNINKFAWDSPTPDDSCLVFISGTSYKSSFGKISNSNFGRIFGVSVNGASLWGFADSFIPVFVSNNFNSEDVDALVNAIIYSSPPTLTTTARPAPPTSTATVHPTTTASPKISSCLFIGDFFYLGDATSVTAFTTYNKQRNFMITVDNEIYNRSSYLANVAIYGYDMLSFADRMENYANEPSNPSDFADNIYLNYPDTYLNIAQPSDVFDEINKFTWDRTVDDSCLVFFSGSPYKSKYGKISNSKFNRIIGVSVNGASLWGFADSFIPVFISNNFDSNDVDALVNAIIYSAPPIPTILLSTTVEPTAANKEFSCMFVMDYQYLGTVDGYNPERDFLSKTSDYLFDNSGGAFTADAVAYGYVYTYFDDEVYQASALQRNDFNAYLASLEAYPDLGFNYELPMDTLIGYLNNDIPTNWPTPSYLVIYSGTLDWQNVAPTTKWNTKKFDHIFGVLLSGKSHKALENHAYAKKRDTAVLPDNGTYKAIFNGSAMSDQIATSIAQTILDSYK